MGQVIISQTTNSFPTNGTSEVQLLTIGGTPTAGNLQFSFNGRIGGTSATWSATNATLLANINAALAVLFGAGSVTASALSLSSGVGTINLTFGGTYATVPQSALIVAINNLTGTAPTAVIALATQGVQSSFRQAAPGAVLEYVGTGLTNAVQTLTIGGTPTTGHFTITGATAQNPNQLLTTANITWSSNNATLAGNIDAVLDTTFGENNLEVALGTITSGVGTLTLTFQGTNAGSAISLFTTTQGTFDGTLAIATTTTGGAAGNTSAVPIPYVNYSTAAFAPNWTPQGAQILLNMGSPVLGTTLTLHTAADTGNDQTFTTFTNQPDVPRCLVSTPSGTTANVTAVQDYVEGTDVNGNFLSETLPAYTAGAATAVTSVNAFKTVTKYIQKANGASVTITTKYSPKIGLPIPVTLTGGATAWLGGTLEATAPTVTVNTTGSISGNLIQLNSALNASAVLVRIVPS